MSTTPEVAGLVPAPAAAVKPQDVVIGNANGKGADGPKNVQAQWVNIVNLVLNGLTVLFLLIILGLLASLKSSVGDLEDSNLLRDGIAATFDEGRMSAMLAAGAAFATKVGNINWELDPDRDSDLCYTRTSWDSCQYFYNPYNQTTQIMDVATCWRTAGCSWDDWSYSCYGSYESTSQRCEVEIDARDQDDIEEVCEKAADAMTDMATGMGTEMREDLDHVPNLHDMLKGLFEADWASYATSCENIANQVKNTDWEDTLDIDENEAGEIRAWAHMTVKLCQKVKLGWGS